MELNLKDAISFEKNTNTHNKCGRDQCLRCGKTCDVSNIAKNSIIDNTTCVDMILEQNLSSTLGRPHGPAMIANTFDSLQFTVRYGALARVNHNSLRDRVQRSLDSVRDNEGDGEEAEDFFTSVSLDIDEPDLGITAGDTIRPLHSSLRERADQRRRDHFDDSSLQDLIISERVIDTSREPFLEPNQDL